MWQHFHLHWPSIIEFVFWRVWNVHIVLGAESNYQWQYLSLCIMTSNDLFLLQRGCVCVVLTGHCTLHNTLLWYLIICEADNLHLIIISDRIWQEYLRDHRHCLICWREDKKITEQLNSKLIHVSSVFITILFCLIFLQERCWMNVKLLIRDFSSEMSHLHSSCTPNKKRPVAGLSIEGLHLLHK